MNPEIAIDLFKSTVMFALYIVAPFLGVTLVVGLVAPILAITGAIILLVKKRRFGVVDWFSLAIGVDVLLLPVMFVLAYSNCPNRIC